MKFIVFLCSAGWRLEGVWGNNREGDSDCLEGWLDKSLCCRNSSQTSRIQISGVLTKQSWGTTLEREPPTHTHRHTQIWIASSMMFLYWTTLSERDKSSQRIYTVPSIYRSDILREKIRSCRLSGMFACLPQNFTGCQNLQICLPHNFDFWERQSKRQM